MRHVINCVNSVVFSLYSLRYTFQAQYNLILSDATHWRGRRGGREGEEEGWMLQILWDSFGIPLGFFGGSESLWKIQPQIFNTSDTNRYTNRYTSDTGWYTSDTGWYQRYYKAPEVFQCYPSTRVKRVATGRIVILLLEEDQLVIPQLLTSTRVAEIFQWYPSTRVLKNR